ncbi:type II toxin-antitoxin system RelE/ParE family toxin [Microseira sp. BLCC-F43]|uniref:type II toxin-antitoxin system RelE family toxin n=1 Tax=Microseira sp. BLCC-F43 TaxID=3153602 RepID=UPI0035B9F3E2
MATKSNYLFQKHPKVDSEDLPALPTELQEDFEQIYKPILMVDPFRCGGFPNHALKGRLKDYRTLEIDWDGVSYRLVYRIYESSAPKRVFVVSFAEHDPAYDKAKERTGRSK